MIKVLLILTVIALLVPLAETVYFSMESFRLNRTREVISTEKEGILLAIAAFGALMVMILMSLFWAFGILSLVDRSTTKWYVTTSIIMVILIGLLYGACLIAISGFIRDFIRHRLEGGSIDGSCRRRHHHR